MDPVNTSLAIDWAIGAVIAFAAALVALRYFKPSPLWALMIGMVIFTGLQFPITTHAVRIDMPVRAK
jgi:hypothetical protein